MSQTKHSKFRNTGILFELLIRQVASDTLSNKDSKAVNLIKKFFNKTELSKEYKLYQTIINSKQLSEIKAENLIGTILNLGTKLNKVKLKHEKYNLIKEIKKCYNIEEFFKAKVNNYKEYASIYNLLENNGNNFIEPKFLIQNKNTLLEHITKIPTKIDESDEEMEEFLKMDKGSRIMVYKILLEKFNSKYSDLIPSQKSILKEYISNMANNNIQVYVNKQYFNIKKELNELNSKVKDKTTQIKLTEIISLINPIPKNQNIKDDDLVNMLYYCQLINEIKEII